MALKIYPVIKAENQCEDYKVKINGRETELNTARVSAVPFNRRRPGHQRGLEQTELINFLSCAADEPLKFEITPENPFQEVNSRLFGRHKPKIFCKGYDERHKTENIIIEKLYWNDRLITKTDGILTRGEFTENIKFANCNSKLKQN